MCRKIWCDRYCSTFWVHFLWTKHALSCIDVFGQNKWDSTHIDFCYKCRAEKFNSASHIYLSEMVLICTYLCWTSLGKIAILYCTVSLFGCDSFFSAILFECYSMPHDSVSILVALVICLIYSFGRKTVSLLKRFYAFSYFFLFWLIGVPQ
jgi:hypothetical protein